MKEIWKDIPQYKGLYQVSDKGNVRSLSHYTRNNTNGGKRLTKGRILSQYIMPNGYLQVQLSKGDERKKFYTHRLVAIAFLRNEMNLSDVNHINGDKNYNSVENLEWCTHQENQIHMVKNRMTRKATPVIHTKTNIEYDSISQAVKETGISKYFINKHCKRENNYEWRFV